MRGGYWVVAIFAAAWASAGIVVAGYSQGLVLLPAVLSAALLFWAYRIPATARDPGAHARKVILRWSLIEGAAFILAVNLLPRMHHADAMFPVAAIIVGLHFLPLARGIPVRSYYLTGVGLVLVGIVGLLLPAAERPLAIGLSAAAILWATALYRLLKAQRTSAATATDIGAGPAI